MATLILGGHSFISQLGNDPRPTEAQTDALVAACLDGGITGFDTTYRPERIALGASLGRLKRRAEAQIIVWNFFETFDDGEPVGGARAYESADLDAILADLQTDWVDELVVHRVGDALADEKQESLAQSWKEAGRVGRLGTWAPGKESQFWPRRALFDFVVEPHNLFTSQSAEKLEIYAQNGWEITAASPFVRGWQMEKLAAIAGRDFGLDAENARAKVADHLLRYSLFSPHVSRLIVAMRRETWVTKNLESAARGPLDEAEIDWLKALKMGLES